MGINSWKQLGGRMCEIQKFGRAVPINKIIIKIEQQEEKNKEKIFKVKQTLPDQSLCGYTYVETKRVDIFKYTKNFSISRFEKSSLAWEM